MAKNYLTEKEFREQRERKKSKNITVLDKNYEYITVKEYAEYIKTTTNEASALCRRGHVEGAFKVGSSWRIPIRKKVKKMFVLRPKNDSRHKLI